MGINTDISGKNRVTRLAFNGVPSGDHECFCWNVDARTFRTITGREPDRHDRAKFPPTEGRFRLYPGDFGGVGYKESGKSERWEIEIIQGPLAEEGSDE